MDFFDNIDLSGIQAFWEDLPDPVNDIILVILAILLIWLLQSFFVSALNRLLNRLVNRTSRKFDDRLLQMTRRPIRLIVIAIGLFAVIQISGISNDTTVFLDNFARTIVIFAFFLLFYQLTSFVTATSRLWRVITGIQVDEKLLPFVRTAARIVIISLGLVIILEEWGYDVGGLIAGLGIGGLAFALAAQDTLANLFGFSTIVGDRVFVEGEFIVTSDVEGTVEHVGIRSTRIRRLDQALVTVPNSTLASSVILNWSRVYKRQIDFKLGITYAANSQQLRELLATLRHTLQAREKVDEDSVVVYFTNFGDSALEILIRCYVYLADWTAFTAEKEQINLSVMEIITNHGLSIAFPSQSVYIENTAAPGKRVPQKPTQLSNEESYNPTANEQQPSYDEDT